MEIEFNDLEQRVLRFLKDEYLEKGEGECLDDPVTTHRDVMDKFRLDVRKYREMIGRFESYGIVEPVLLGDPGGFLKIGPSIVEIVRQLEQQTERPRPHRGSPANSSVTPVATTQTKAAPHPMAGEPQTPDTIRVRILEAIAALDELSIHDRALAQNLGLSVEQVRAHLEILARQRGFHLVQASGAHIVLLTAGQKQHLTEELAARQQAAQTAPSPGASRSNTTSRQSALTRKKGNIFIGHGHSRVWKDLKDFLQDRLHLQWDEFNREPTAGLSTKERLQKMLDNACFAFLVMTAEETRAGATAHARDNVIHEVGLFQGRLGFQRAIVLLEEGCSEFSNIAGLTQIRFPKDNIEAKFEEIRRVLEREGIPGDGKYITVNGNRRSPPQPQPSGVPGTRPQSSQRLSGSRPSLERIAEPARMADEPSDKRELRRLQREALAASRRSPEDMALFEQKLNEVDLLEGVSSVYKLNTLCELGQEVALNSDRGTILLIEHILWQIAGWNSPSIVPEIMEIAAARALLRQIAGALWDIGVTAVEYGRKEDAVQRVANAVLEVAKKSRMINEQEALATCEQGVESMLGAAQRDKRTHVISLLEEAVLRLTGEEETA